MVSSIILNLHFFFQLDCLASKLQALLDLHSTEIKSAYHGDQVFFFLNVGVEDETQVFSALRQQSLLSAPSKDVFVYD